ncbi:AbrB/MazE/SpoVT family DNA-binding domain-containing protein [Pseudoduganella namucuonensis]|nr:PbsX family transcriptional regulator [Pseudoduganella namucuonensis]
MLRKWGNSPAVRLSAAMMEAADLTLNQPVTVRTERGRVIIEPVFPVYALDELLAGITPQNLHAEQDTGPGPRQGTA